MRTSTTVADVGGGSATPAVHWFERIAITKSIVPAVPAHPFQYRPQPNTVVGMKVKK
jgi:hypothetical protein